MEEIQQEAGYHLESGKRFFFGKIIVFFEIIPAFSKLKKFWFFAKNTP